jgi:hypothetical protein
MPIVHYYSSLEKPANCSVMLQSTVDQTRFPRPSSWQSPPQRLCHGHDRSSTAPEPKAASRMTGRRARRRSSGDPHLSLRRASKDATTQEVPANSVRKVPTAAKLLKSSMLMDVTRTASDSANPPNRRCPGVKRADPDEAGQQSQSEDCGDDRRRAAVSQFGRLVSTLSRTSASDSPVAPAISATDAPSAAAWSMPSRNDACPFSRV